MVFRLKSTKQEGWLYRVLRNGCVCVAFAGLCGTEYRECCREQIEVKDAKSGEFRAVTEDDLKGHTEMERGPFDRTADRNVRTVTDNALDDQPFSDTFQLPPGLQTDFPHYGFTTFGDSV